MIRERSVCGIAFVILSVQFSFTQTLRLHGQITSDDHTPLEYANVTAFPLLVDQDIKFCMSDDSGRYQLHIKRDIKYIIQIRYLGFNAVNDTLIFKTDIEKNFILVPNSYMLGGVTISAPEVPVIVKEDTTIFTVSSFSSGHEQKLRDVLKKLPGIEVDKEGNVNFNGKKVDKLLVENEPFFTGSTKFGVNNLPANVVSKVELLNNYSEIGYMKGLVDDGKLAMNIKLKEDRKKFTFGEIELGAGVKDRYLFHPILFYYSPKTTINFIGDINNSGTKAFTISDFFEFDGGFSKIMNDPIRSLNNTTRSWIRTLLNENFVNRRSEFGALHIVNNISSKLKLNFFSINDRGTLSSRIENENSFLFADQIQQLENRTTENNSKNFNSLNKIELTYKPAKYTDIRYASILKISDLNMQDQILSWSDQNKNDIYFDQYPNQMEWKQNIDWNQKWNPRHATTLQSSMNFYQEDIQNHLLLDTPLSSQILLWEGNSPYQLEENGNGKNTDFAIGIKHVWSVNDLNQIHFLASSHTYHQEYATNDHEKTAIGLLSLEKFGFNNSIKMQLTDPSLGIKYRWKWSEITGSIGTSAHWYHWNIHEHDVLKVNRIKTRWIPDVVLKWAHSSNEVLEGKYEIRSRFEEVSSYASRYRLQGWTTFFKGNLDLENEWNHQFSLNYFKNKYLKGTIFNAALNYTKSETQNRATTDISGIQRIATLGSYYLPDNSINARVLYSRKINPFNFKLSGFGIWSDYYRDVNGFSQRYNVKNVSFSFNILMQLKKYLRLDLGMQKRNSIFSTQNTNIRFKTFTPSLEWEFNFLRDFSFEGNYEYNYNRNLTSDHINRFQKANLELRYEPENAHWKWSILINNLFGAEYRSDIFYDQFLVSESRTYFQPRVIMLKSKFKF